MENIVLLFDNGLAIKNVNNSSEYNVIGESENEKYS